MLKNGTIIDINMREDIKLFEFTKRRKENRKNKLGSYFNLKEMIYLMKFLMFGNIIHRASFTVVFLLLLLNLIIKIIVDNKFFSKEIIYSNLIFKIERMRFHNILYFIANFENKVYSSNIYKD